MNFELHFNGHTHNEHFENLSDAITRVKDFDLNKAFDRPVQITFRGLTVANISNTGVKIVPPSRKGE